MDGNGWNGKLETHFGNAVETLTEMNGVPKGTFGIITGFYSEDGCEMIRIRFFPKHEVKRGENGDVDWDTLNSSVIDFDDCQRLRKFVRCIWPEKGKANGGNSTPQAAIRADKA